VYKWTSIFTLAKPNGFVYFNAYVNTQTNGVAGWVTRGKYNPEVYNIYHIDASGKIIVGQRGTVVHALQAVQGGVAASVPQLNIPLSQFTLRT
jgi:hypothetical protein